MRGRNSFKRFLGMAVALFLLVGSGLGVAVFLFAGRPRSGGMVRGPLWGFLERLAAFRRFLRASGTAPA